VIDSVTFILTGRWTVRMRLTASVQRVVEDPEQQSARRSISDTAPVTIPYDVSESDSELTSEKAGFLARANCVEAVGGFLTQAYGSNYHGALVEGLSDQLKTKPKRPLPPDAARLLRIAWQTEAAARLPTLLNDPLFQGVSVLTLPVHVYYALFNSLRALSIVSGARADHHESIQRDFANNRVTKLPLPWGLSLIGDPRAPESVTLTPKIVTPYAFSPVERTHEAEAYLWAALRMARTWRLAVQRKQWLRDNRRANGKPYKVLPPGRGTLIAESLRPTTLLDFVYELRRQVSYQTADQYAVDASGAELSRFHVGMGYLLDTGLLLIESWVAHISGREALRAAADEWKVSTRRISSWAAQPLEARLAAIFAG
jgi:hypothetical protein